MPNGLDTYSDRHATQRMATLADQAELQALRLGTSIVEDGLSGHRIAEAMDDFDSGIEDIEQWNANDLRLENASGPALENVVRRRELLGAYYPFETREANLEYTPSASLVYEFCLAICTAPSITQGDYTELPRKFERLSCMLARTYLGPGGNAYHTGWPRDADAPVNFRDMMAPLHDRTGEWVWSPEDGLPVNPSPKIAKDEGIDLVAWKRNIDGRRGHLFLLGQCACGDNWLDKFDDANPNKLQKWFHPMTLIFPPRKMFFTPFHAVDAVLEQASREAGIVLDRIRLTLLANHCGALHEDDAFRSELRRLIDLVLVDR